MADDDKLTYDDPRFDRAFEIKAVIEAAFNRAIRDDDHPEDVGMALQFFLQPAIGMVCSVFLKRDGRADTRDRMYRWLELVEQASYENFHATLLGRVDELVRWQRNELDFESTEQMVAYRDAKFPNRKLTSVEWTALCAGDN